MFFLFTPLLLFVASILILSTDKLESALFFGGNSFLIACNIFFGTADLSKDRIEQHQYQKYCNYHYPGSELTEKGCFLDNIVYPIPYWIKFPTDFISLSDKKDEEVKKSD